MLIALIFGIRRKKGDGRVVLSGFPRYLVCWNVTAVFSGALLLSRSLHASDQQMCG
jgi:hypothetical protein